ncbi:MAG TPA: hypothetical protein ENF27_00410 [Chloroflexi bacterium]|nr:hypothetical protein [Chloroflexota bacterium]
MFRWLQNYPHFLEIVYDLLEVSLHPLKRWFKPGSRSEPFIIAIEKLGKETVFGCQMCGQCILHSTGMTCPMTCPKHLRNGPCGGVRQNGKCEVKTDMNCVWVEAYERSLKMPTYGHQFASLQPPMNNQLIGSSSWINMFHGIDIKLPQGWSSTRDIPVKFINEDHDGNK